MKIQIDRQRQQGLTIELVLDDVVEDLEEEEHEVVVGGVGEQKPWRGESL